MVKHMDHELERQRWLQVTPNNPPETGKMMDVLDCWRYLSDAWLLGWSVCCNISWWNQLTFVLLGGETYNEPKCDWGPQLCRDLDIPWQNIEHSLLLEEDQWLQRASVLYRPEIIWDCTILMLTLYGEGHAVVKIGCGTSRLMNWGSKNCREGRSAASLGSSLSQ